VIERSHAVFLSYASQDTEAAQGICRALRAAGIEVFFDQSELRGGDAWDQKIRREIHDCALFIPVISARTASRREGYFRLEWDLADQRSHMMARDRPFIVPVCLDATPGTGTDAPEAFQRVQWARLPGGATSSEFVEHIRRLLLAVPPAAATNATTAVAVIAEGARRSTAPAYSRSRRVLPAIAAVIAAVALAYLLANKFWISRHVGAPAPLAAAVAPRPAPIGAAIFSPPPHSVAVLPFVNMSRDKGQDYFSDGLSEELLNSLSRINELQVAARTSSFYFKGEHADLPTIARKLNVASILEGSVRRSGHTVRITAQLINAVTGFRLWSQSYDRDLGDVLKLQSEIANAVAVALRVTLLSDEAARIQLGGTRNAAAFDSYLRASKSYIAHPDGNDMKASIAAYTEAIALDANFALAFAGRSLALNRYAAQFATGPAIRATFDGAQSDARKAIALAPDLAEGHLALGLFFESGSLDFARASDQYDRAFALAPGNAVVLHVCGRFAASMGRVDSAIAAEQHAVALDPLNATSHSWLGLVLYFARRYPEAIAAHQSAVALDPLNPLSYASSGRAYYLLGNYHAARASCEAKPDYWLSQLCLAITYDKLKRSADAERMLAALKASLGDAAAYQYAQIYAQRGDAGTALSWLETALRLRDPGLQDVKMDPLLDPLRREPRFQAIERELMFPD
jgi:TolB-like protein/Tfp pilus assembly protein PilF